MARFEGMDKQSGPASGPVPAIRPPEGSILGRHHDSRHDVLARPVDRDEGIPFSLESSQVSLQR